ncbi:hypothetical protein C8A01DRAFT_20509 [Parachaetomium inaequale]|uniref:Uncharacterized protein n=1 Tax=Parachaetomium inaequale TaxID=2588326 RepID=A0AAN6P605_9PEZI|nr:hypothetical protein C8A01DRAFT_20509 [Parachaetomium inaequale]
METTTVNQSSPLGIARKPLGLAGFAGGPLKPITQGFAIFFEALLCSVALGNADTIETLSHLDICAVNDAHLTKSVSDKVIKEDKHTIEAPVIASDITTDCDKSDTETVAAECTLATENTLALSTESAIKTPENSVITEENASPKEDTITCAEDIAPVDISSVVDITLDTEPTVAESTTHTPTIIDTASDSPEEAEATEIEITTATESVAAECTLDTDAQATEDISDTSDTLITPQDETVAITPAADSTQATIGISVSDDIPESPLEAIEPTEDIQVTAEVVCTEDTHVADIAIETTEVIQETPASETAQAIQDMPPALKNIAVPGLVEDSESDIKAVIRDILETNEDLDFDTDIEAEAENELTQRAVHTMESIPEKELATIPMPAPTYPLIFEDDFDAAVSSIFNVQFEDLMDIDAAWSIPRIAEKGKSEREILRERLANKETAQFNPQNLRLEKAARALTINGPVPVKAATKTAEPAAETATPTTPVEPETAVPKDEAETLADAENKTEALETTFSDTEEATIQKAKEITSRNHSRSSSESSTVSNLSAEAGFDSAPCPGTPMTEHTGTPTKKGASQAISTEETIPQQAIDTGKNIAGNAENQTEEPAAEAIAEEEDETTD